MTYTVEKLAAGRWQLMCFEPGRMIGTRLGVYETRAEAVQRAKQLAGRQGVVHLFERMKSSPLSHSRV